MEAWKDVGIHCVYYNSMSNCMGVVCMIESGKKTFAIYVRVSRTDQVLENQINPLVSYAERMGWDYEIFKEKESTRKTRPVQWDLYNRLLKKEFHGLLFYKLDRWARSLKELVTHMEALHEKNVILVSYMENIDLSTSSGKLMMNVMGSFAEFERDIIRERTLAGLARAKAQGKKLGRRKGSKNKKTLALQGRLDIVNEK